MNAKFSTKYQQFLPQSISFHIGNLKEFSTKFAPPIFPHIYVENLIYTKYLTQPF